MEKIITLLEEKNMKFGSKYEKIQAQRYISYNTSWSMLKKSCNLIKFDKKKDGYATISFQDVQIAERTNYYYSQMLKPLVENFEHYLKVNMSYQFTKLSIGDKQCYIQDLHEFIMMHRDLSIRNIPMNSDALFILHDKLTLSDLIYVNNLMGVYNKDVLLIEKNICKIRNKLSHHSNILKKHKKNKNDIRRDSEILTIYNYYGIQCSKKQLKFLSLDYDYNTLLQILRLLYYTDYFLSQDSICKNQKDYMYLHIDKYLRKAIYEYNTLDIAKKEEWVEIGFLILKEFIQTYTNAMNVSQ